MHIVIIRFFYDYIFMIMNDCGGARAPLVIVLTLSSVYLLTRPPGLLGLSCFTPMLGMLEGSSAPLLVSAACEGATPCDADILLPRRTLGSITFSYALVVLELAVLVAV